MGDTDLLKASVVVVWHNGWFGNEGPMVAEREKKDQSSISQSALEGSMHPDASWWGDVPTRYRIQRSSTVIEFGRFPL
jgi:hypothetical protein